MVGLARPFGGALRRRPVSKPAQHAGFFFALRALSGNVGRLVGDPRMRRHLTKLLTTWPKVRFPLYGCRFVTKNALA
ncbi:hypothetical protein DF122_30125 [Burkholderia pseudomallei]|nr:hypothetical protein BOC47_26835 [Burkholderia pseudomallei]EEC38136.1 conserved hypothetical protein [Burkholderia pseudomallei 576]ARL32511.1 hypothetical protein BOC48_24695 [Burkholderia pseudomallei]ARL75322.1 hypothetical protein BOC54_23355 [Burkholderia pseudomallei]ARL81924.1 hypothetical protein BOC55_21675 [Burkholderia pseudomallei]